MNSNGAGAIELQPRDLEFLERLFETRLITLRHTTALYFEGREDAAKKRVQKLKAAKLVGERPRRPYSPSILFLTQKGFAELSERGVLSRYPQLSSAAFEKRAHVSDLTLKHELDILEAKTALTLAIRERPGFEIVEFSTWPALFEFDSAPGPHEPNRIVRPDGFIRVRQVEADGAGHEHIFFLEVDRSTEVLERLAAQAGCYREYYQRGGLGMSLGETERIPFRVLMVFQNAERRNNATDSLLRLTPPIMGQVWLATLPDLRANPLGPIWIRPVDYRDATRDTPFDSRVPRSWPYRRHPEREELVEASVAMPATSRCNSACLTA